MIFALFLFAAALMLPLLVGADPGLMRIITGVTLVLAIAFAVADLRSASNTADRILNEDDE